MTKDELRKSLDFVNEERERLQRENEDLRSAIADYQEAVGDYQDELKRKDNIINELKKYLQENSTRPDLWECDAYYKEILDKIKELESKGEEN